MKSVKLKKIGFTLVELLVVITIIGILATISAINYLPALKRTRLNNSVETVVSIIKESKVKTMAGEGLGATNPSRCYGLELKPSAVSFDLVLTQVYMDYVNDACDLAAKKLIGYINLDERVELENIMVEGGSGAAGNTGNFLLYFIPPKGDVQLAGYQEASRVEIDFAYKGESSALYRKKLSFDLIIGRIDYPSS